MEEPVSDNRDHNMRFMTDSKMNTKENNQFLSPTMNHYNNDTSPNRSRLAHNASKASLGGDSVNQIVEDKHLGPEFMKM